MIRISRSLALLGLVAAAPARATTLQELLDSAETKNVDRQITLEQRERAAADFKAAWSSLLPGVSAQGGWTRNEIPTQIQIAPGAPTIVITPRDQFDAVVRVDFALIDTTRWFRTAAAGAADDAAEYRDEMMRDNVRRQVSTTYYSYAAALAFRESAQRSVTVAQAQQGLMEVRAKAGAATELELLRAKAEVQRNRQLVVDAESMVANVRRSLRTLTGIELSEKAVLPQDNLTPEGTLEELEAKSSELPAVKAAERDALAAARLAWAARLALIPTVSANFVERITNATGFVGRANSYTAGIGFSWRLDGPGAFGIKSQSAVAQVANLAAERQRLFSRDQVHTDWRRMLAAIEKVSAAQAQVESANRAAQVARDRYAAGAATQIDVIQSERDLSSAEFNHIQARTELASSHVGLRISAGLPLNVQ